MIAAGEGETLNHCESDISKLNMSAVNLITQTTKCYFITCQTYYYAYISTSEVPTITTSLLCPTASIHMQINATYSLICSTKFPSKPTNFLWRYSPNCVAAVILSLKTQSSNDPLDNNWANSTTHSLYRQGEWSLLSSCIRSCPGYLVELVLLLLLLMFIIQWFLLPYLPKRNDEWDWPMIRSVMYVSSNCTGSSSFFFLKYHQTIHNLSTGVNM